MRKSPLHDWAKKNGAVFVETGLWYPLRPGFPRAGETTWRESVDREVLNVRAECRASAMSRRSARSRSSARTPRSSSTGVYCNAFLKLPVGKARYGLMLREDGCIYDDGTTSRLGEDHFFMTTTTAYAAGVMNHLEFCAQALWPDLDVRFASVDRPVGADGGCRAEGARRSCRRWSTTISRDAAFPFLAARASDAERRDSHGRLFRISFSGELAYELAVPAGYGEASPMRSWQRASRHGICPYGVEALGVLRIEKGHVTHAEINGTVDAGRSRLRQDGLGHQARLHRQGDAVARGHAGARPPVARRRQAARPRNNFKTGSHILARAPRRRWKTIRAMLPPVLFAACRLDHRPGARQARAERHGEEVLVWDALRDSMTPALLCPPCFVDPENVRLHV